MSQDETSKTPQYFVDPEAEVAMTVAPEFEGTEYENGITTVKGLPYTFVHVHVHVLLRDEKEERKKQAMSNKQQSKATQHIKGSQYIYNIIRPLLHIVCAFVFAYPFLSLIRLLLFAA